MKVCCHIPGESIFQDSYHGELGGIFSPASQQNYLENSRASSLPLLKSAAMANMLFEMPSRTSRSILVNHNVIFSPQYAAA
jgi:hypothetical protein